MPESFVDGSAAFMHLASAGYVFRNPSGVHNMYSLTRGLVRGFDALECSMRDSEARF